MRRLRSLEHLVLRLPRPNGLATAGLATMSIVPITQRNPSVSATATARRRASHNTWRTTSGKLCPSDGYLRWGIGAPQPKISRYLSQHGLSQPTRSLLARVVQTGDVGLEGDDVGIMEHDFALPPGLGVRLISGPGPPP